MKRFIFILLSSTLLISNSFSQSQVVGKDVINVDDVQKKSSDVYKSATSEANPSDKALWTFKGMAGVDLSQAYFANWSEGGENSVAFRGYLNAGAYYRKGKSAWDTDLALEFGQVFAKYGTDDDAKFEWRKNADKIDLASKYGYAINNKLFYSALGGFKTQFAKGYNYPNRDNHLSNFMAPGYVTLSVGLDYKPFKALSIFASPVTGRFTFVMDDSLSNAGAFGVDPGEKYRAQLGAYAKFVYGADIMKNVNLKTTLELFTAYDEYFVNHTDVNWDVVIGMKINKYLTATISTSLRYDDDIKYINSKGEESGPRIQFKETIGIGLAYKF